MSADPIPQQHLGDRPLPDPQLDELGHAALAKRIADDIGRYATVESTVFAVNAPWGMGKSTVLNFVEHYLGDGPASQQFAVVRFNPWWHGGEDGLVRGFFHQLLAGLAPEKEELEKLRADVAKLAELLQLIPAPEANTLSRLVAWVIRPKNQDLVSLKRDIAALLVRRGVQFVVLIDDVDRLTRAEVALLFRLIKAVVDFPGVSYLMAFDRDHVAKELEAELSSSGYDFLEKIVQVQYELPPPASTRLSRMFFNRLDQVIRNVPEKDFDKQRWAKIHFDGVSKLVVSPRDVVRVTNSLRLNFPKVMNEVDTVDYIALEVLRVKQPIVYQLIRGDQEMFVGSADRRNLRRSNEDVERTKAFHDAWLGQVPEHLRKAVKTLVTIMFPKLASVWSTTTYGVDWEADWLRRRRICSAQVFPVYFRLETPDGEFSRTEMKQILSKTASQRDFADTLRELVRRKHPSGTTMAKKLLLEIQNYTEKDIPIESIPTAVAALFDVGDELLVPEDEPQGVFDFGSDFHIGRATWQLIRRLDETDRFSILESAFKNGAALTMICREVRTLASQHEKPDEGKEQKPKDTIVSPEHLEVLKLAVVNRIREAVKRDGLKTVRDIRVVLPTWNWLAGGIDEGVAWVRGVASDVHGLAWLLKSLATVLRSQAAGEYLPKKRLRLNPKSVEPALPRESIVDRIRVIASAEWATQDEKAAAAEYLREYEVLANGEDPDSPRAFDHDE